MATSSKEEPDILWTVPDQQALTYIEAKHLNSLFVSCYDVQDPDSPAPNNHGYQRNPDVKRFKPIARYYTDNPSRIPPLIISVRLTDPGKISEFCKLLKSRDFKTLSKKFSRAVMSIVDGQHRAGGLQLAADSSSDLADLRVPLALFFGMTFEEEAEEFNTINSSQRKLPKALIETTKGDISERNEISHAQQIRQIAFGVARDKDSIWFDQINMTGGRHPNQKVTYEGMRRSTANMFPAELLGRLKAADIDALRDIAKPFWNQIASMFPDAWNGKTRESTDPDTGDVSTEQIQYRLKELVGVASLARLGREITASVIDAHQEFGIPIDKALMKKMEPLRHVNWEKREDNPYMAPQAGFAGQSQLYSILYKLVYEKVDPEGNQII